MCDVAGDGTPDDQTAGAKAGDASRGLRVQLPGAGIMEYLPNGGVLEVAARIAGHESTRTTQLRNRVQEEISLDEIERIHVRGLTICRRRAVPEGLLVERQHAGGTWLNGHRLKNYAARTEMGVRARPFSGKGKVSGYLRSIAGSSAELHSGIEQGGVNS